MNRRRLIRHLEGGLGHHRAGRFAEALSLYNSAREEDPRDFDAVHLAGTAELQLGRAAEAVATLGIARRLDSKSAVCAMRLGAALCACRRFAAAESELRAALALDSALPEAWYHLARALEQLGRLDEALAAAETAVAARANYPEAQDYAGALCAAVRGQAAAEPFFRKAVEQDPQFARAWCNLGICLTYLGRLTEALSCQERALALDPGLTHAHAGRGLALERGYRLADAVDAYGRAVASDPRNHQAHSARLLTLHYLSGVSRETLLREHALFGATIRRHIEPGATDWSNAPDPERRLKVGFLSPNFRAHSVAYFIDPLLAHLDRDRFEIFLYHDHAKTDDISAVIRSRADHWRATAGQPHAAVESLVRADRLDILIDLTGHSDLNRLPVFARRVAPIQATYLGYPNTTGVQGMDYRLVDATTDPPGEADAFCTEKLARFAPTGWLYAPPPGTPAPALGPRSGQVVFGCFNNFTKVTDETLHAWGRILTQWPESRLMFKGAGLGDPTLQADARRRFASAGIDPERTDLMNRVRSQSEHLGLYDRMDIALDTFPYHGTTTTCEALWMGVPTITLAGDRHSSRVGVSLLQSIGRSEWIARSWDEYVRIATGLAAAPARREALRASLRGEMMRSPLLDHAGQADRFGASLREMWRNWCAARAKETFSLPEAEEAAVSPGRSARGKFVHVAYSAPTT